MHDPKFEHEVQRKMHDLEFVPSESVWAGIRQGIAPRRRRRVAVLIWWLIPGMLLVAGGIVMYRHSASTGGVAAAVPAVRTGKVVPGGSGSSIVGNGTEGNGIRVAGNGTAGTGNRVGENGNGGTGGVENGNEGNGNGESGRAKRAAGMAGSVAGGGEERIVGGEGSIVGGEERISRYRPGLVMGLGFRRGVDGPPLEWQPVNTAVSGISRPRHPWAVGFAAGGGAASVYSGAGGALTTLSTSTANASNNASTYNLNRPQALANSSTAGSAKQNKTDVQPSYSYWA